MPLRTAKNVIDGIEYAASIIAVRKRIPLEIEEDDSLAYLLTTGETMYVQHEILVGRKGSSFSMLFAPKCVVFVSDSLMRFDEKELHQFVDMMLEYQDFKTLTENDPLCDFLDEFHMSRVVLKARRQVLLGMRKVKLLLFHRDPRIQVA